MNVIAQDYNKQNTQYNLKRGYEDLSQSLKSWRIIFTMGINDIKSRYVRSKLGQFWLTLSLAINIATLAVVFGCLFKVPIKTFLPYIAISIIFWTFINTVIIEGTMVLINNANYLRALTIGKSSYIFSLFVRNIIILGHNLLILIPLSFFCTFSTSINTILISFCGFLLTLMFLFPITLLTSVISLRYRDLPNTINSIMQIALYVTPIMWKVVLMPERLQKLLIFNPFAVFLTICRDSFIIDGPAQSAQYWIAAVCYVVLSWLIGFPFFCKFRQRITYWL